MRALHFDGRRARVVDHDDPESAPGMARVAVRLAGICNTDLEIARAAKPRPIGDVAAELGVDPVHLVPYGRGKAKIVSPLPATPRGRPQGPGGLPRPAGKPSRAPTGAKESGLIAPELPAGAI